MQRYENECKMLAYLAKRQLNLPKNKVKEKFEDISILKILHKLKEESVELEDELLLFKMSGFAQKDKIDVDKAFSELGDVAACCVGILAWLNKYKQFQEDDCA